MANRGPEPATLHLLPTLWFRNTWSWGCRHEGCEVKPKLRAVGETRVQCDHATLGRYFFEVEGVQGAAATTKAVELLFTENETNVAKLFGGQNASAFTKDAFHERVVGGRREAVNPARVGTKCAAHQVLVLAPGEERVVRLRLYADTGRPAEGFGKNFTQVFAARRGEANQFFDALLGSAGRNETQSPFARGRKKTAAVEIDGGEARRIARQAYAGLLWSKQFYHYVVPDWLAGDPAQPPPPAGRKAGRNSDWPHLFARDVLSMPDKWEYPWVRSRKPTNHEWKSHPAN
ncbi:MAG: hypothetical protein EXS32_15300 [Opitutus sp.]|nr:hypothetical protein [Opitutus sp.]